MIVRAFAVWAVLVVGAAEARADASFVWAAPATCPAAADVRARIEARLGMPIDGSVHGISVAIAHEGGQFVARIDMRAVALANEPRTLKSGRCDELADAVAIVVARLASEVRVAARERERAAAAAEAEAAPRVVTAAAPARGGAGRWGGGGRAVAVSGIGILPGVGIAAEVAAYARRREHFLEVAATRWARSPKYLVTGAPGGVDVSLTTLALRAGWSPTQMYIRAWGVFEAGPMTGEGIALADPRIGSGRWMAGGGGFGVSWPMSDRARLVGSVEFLAAFEQVRFVLSNGGEVYRPSSFVARSALGLEIGWR